VRARLLLAAVLLPLAALAQDAVAKQEIDHLIAHLASSGCEFNRNGSWYDAASAVSHIQRKYAHLRDHGLVPTPEAFIERAASESSMSGTPYRVRCPGQPEVRSAEWFRAELAKFRSK
jgi:Family of unknown function (DUF5329)